MKNLKTNIPRTAAGAKTLAQRYYLSEEIYELETKKIFSAHWLYGGRLGELTGPGVFFLFETDGESIIVLKDENEDIRAFYNVCRHRGTRLCEDRKGQVSKSIRCPYHAWTYKLDGTLRSAPNMNEVEGFRVEDYPLHPVSTAIWEGGIFLNLSESPEPFERSFAPLLNKFDRWQFSELQIVQRIEYEISANWKLVFQNYSECYHCPALHPHLNKLTPYRNSSNDLESGPFLGGPMKLAQKHGSMTMSGNRCAVPLAGITEDLLDLVYYYTIFPNMLLSLHPDYVLIHRIERLAVDKTRIFCDWLFHPNQIEQKDFDPSEAVEFWNMTNQQDWQVSELSQKGIRSRSYQPGPYSNLESMIANWDRHYLQMLHD